MAKMRGILRPEPKSDPAEVELELERAQARIAVRMVTLFGPGIAAPPEEAPSTEAGAEAADEAALEAADEDTAREVHGPVDGTAPAAGERTGGPRPPIVVERQRVPVPVVAESDELFVGVMVEHGEVHLVPVVPESQLLVGVMAEDVPVDMVGWPGDGSDAPEVGDPDPQATTSVEAPAMPLFATADAPTVGEEAGLAPPVRRRAKGATPAPPHPKKLTPDAPRADRSPASRPSKARSNRAPTTTSPSCPYCATILQPPPVTSRRCPQCLHRVVVRRVEGRVAYLTEAVIPVFEAERRRIADCGRWTRDRQRWLKLATSVGAPAERVARLDATRPSQAVVDAARSLYGAAVDRSFNAAKRERRWEDASRIRREQALALHRIAGSPKPPPEETIALLREGAVAELKEIAKVARVAELVGATCCDACRADDGRVFQIAAELKAPRLPHTGCPRGLCRCRWSLAVRDRTTVQRYVRRRSRPGSPDARSGPSPTA